MSEYRTVFRPEAQAELRRIPRERPSASWPSRQSRRATRSGPTPRLSRPGPTAVASGWAIAASSTRSTTRNWWHGSSTSDTDPPSTTRDPSAPGHGLRHRSGTGPGRGTGVLPAARRPDLPPRRAHSDVEAECPKPDPDLRRNPAHRPDQAFLRWRPPGPDGRTGGVLRTGCGPDAPSLGCRGPPVRHPQPQASFSNVLQPGDGDGVELPRDRRVVNRLQRRPHRLDRPAVVTGHCLRRLVQSRSPCDRVPLATPHASRPSLARPASSHHPHRPQRTSAAP